MKKLMNRTGLLAVAFALALAVALALNSAARPPAVAQSLAATPTATATPTPTPTPTSTPTQGSDTDGNGLIEISTAAQLNAMRYDLDGDGEPGYDMNGDGIPDDSVPAADRTAYTNHFLGCPAAAECKGYELMADISLAEYATGARWQPIGPHWQAVFDGNGFSITDLEGQNGLFSAIGAGNKDVDDKTIVKNVDVVGAIITPASTQGGGVGVLAAANHATIIGSYVTGELTRNATLNNGRLGGLVGFNKGTIAASVADVDITLESIPPGERLRVGGLAGVNYGAIHRSYAYGDVIDARSNAARNATGAGIFHAQGFAVNHSIGTIESSLSYGKKITTKGDDNVNNDVRTLAKFAHGGQNSDSTPNPSNAHGLINSCALADESKFTCPTPTPTPTPTATPTPTN